MSVPIPPEETVKLHPDTLANLELAHCKQVLDLYGIELVEDVKRYLQSRIDLFIGISSYLMSGGNGGEKLNKLFKEVYQNFERLRSVPDVEKLFSKEITIRKSVWYDNFKGLQTRTAKLIQQPKDGSAEFLNCQREIAMVAASATRYLNPGAGIPEYVEYSDAKGLLCEGIRLVSM